VRVPLLKHWHELLLRRSGRQIFLLKSDMNFSLEEIEVDEIIELENRRIEAMTKQDAQVLDEILADDLSYTHSTARVETKAEFISSVTSGRTKYRSMERDDVKVRQYGDTAVVTGHAKVHVDANGREIKFNIRFIDVYAKRDDVWRMVAWQSTKLPD